jgi:hypothetical protein
MEHNADQTRFEIDVLIRRFGGRWISRKNAKTDEKAIGKVVLDATMRVHRDACPRAARDRL